MRLNGDINVHGVDEEITIIHDGQSLTFLKVHLSQLLESLTKIKENNEDSWSDYWTAALK
jgi:hypothetical protein